MSSVVSLLMLVLILVLSVVFVLSVFLVGEVTSDEIITSSVTSSV